MSGPDVADLQRRLGVDADGYYGPITAAAVEDWKWRVGYPARLIDTKLGVRGQRWLLGREPLPEDYERRARERQGVERPVEFVWPLSTSPGTRSEFSYVDAEGAPDRSGVRHHAGKDWFAPGGSEVRAPVAGKIVEVKPSRGSSGQIFGGTVKIESDKDKRVWVFRHVTPKSGLTIGRHVAAGDVVARVTKWADNPRSSHAHIELWKTLEGGYRYENMVDPMSVFR